MSSTYVVGKAVSACVDERGTVFFLLMEKTYESNCYPQVPRWGVRFFGAYEACLARIIGGGGSVEGGSCKGDATTATAWIRQWREQLANPGTLSKQVITAEIGGGLYKLPEEHRQAANKLLLSRGFAAVENDRLTIDMTADGALQLLADLTDGRFEGFYPWRFFRNNGPSSEPCPGLGVPVPAAAKAKLDVSVYTLGSEREGWDEQHVIAGPAGLRITGWDYSTVASFIDNEAIAMEMAQPGSAEPAITAFRKVLKAKQKLPGQTRVTVQQPDARERWHRSCFEQLCELTGKPQTESLVFSPADLVGDAIRMVAHLGDRYVRFELPSNVTLAARAEQLEMAV
ncbi:hypothetical protein [Rubrivivax gelatinosus]|uniref:hypothetical protein n=1 Tax=Rubrivivax gelatinosus TaxID=28068 RepID=UPI0005C1F65E|nr:hypothetical protein [Rubrivivax gelatinosus]MBG6083055.1 hypothetical protein [Rubrivivax gelatinosus]